MQRSSLEFAFGGAFGDKTCPCEKFEEQVLLASQAAERLNSTPPSEEGYGWISLPDADTSVIKETAEHLACCDSVIQIGIGGSALGNLMLHQSILGDLFNTRKDFPKFYLADNPDPVKVRSILNAVRGGRTALIGVSKSGETPETLSQFLFFKEELSKADPNIIDVAVVITDPRAGVFCEFAKNSGCCLLSVSPAVGGRFSVLSPVGLLSACILGVNIDEILNGAAKARDKLLAASAQDKNPAVLKAALHCFHEKEGRAVSVLMPYSSNLTCFSEWFAQLWAESLGKNGKGTTLVRAVGAVDQHSQLQLYMDGPDDKFYTLINIEHRGTQASVPKAEDIFAQPASYLFGKDIGRMLTLEAKSTAAALLSAGRPLVWIEIDRLDEFSLGALIFFCEYTTALTGLTMGIDPFDQPGVERSKRYTCGLLGKEGCAGDVREAELWFGKIKGRTTLKL